MNSELNNILDNSPIVRLEEMLSDFLGTLLTFCQNYLFCLIAIGLWVKIGMLIISGRRVSVILVMLAIACSAIAISIGAFFW